MLIEIRGTGNQNKGAEMMLLTAMRYIRVPGARFVYSPALSPDQYAFYSSYGLNPKAALTYKGLRLDAAAGIIPKRLRDAYGLVLDRELDAIVDASGFAYSDHWGNEPSRRMATDTKRWKRSGKKIILLPQAFGPFTNDRIRGSIKTIVENSDLIYARDEQSFNALKQIDNSSILRNSPDFTVLFCGEIPFYFNPSLHQVCIVPNQRVIDKLADPSTYIEFLAAAIRYVQGAGLSPYFLIHGGREDEILSQRINSALSAPIPLVNEPNPLYIKGLIESALGLIGSRYHSIASALYSGTVSIGIGWSHKYEYLFSEMGFDEGLVDIDIDKEVLLARLQIIFDPVQRQQTRSRLLASSAHRKQQALQMFGEVSECLAQV